MPQHPDPEILQDMTVQCTAVHITVQAIDIALTKTPLPQLAQARHKANIQNEKILHADMLHVVSLLLTFLYMTDYFQVQDNFLAAQRLQQVGCACLCPFENLDFSVPRP